MRHLLAAAYAFLVVGAVWVLLLPGEAWAVAYRAATGLRRIVAS